ncbi:MAG: glutathione S-transferase family protein [Burkholderiaceae bacterium]
MTSRHDTGLVLYHAWASTCSQKVRFALAEKGLAWEGHALSLRDFEHLSDAFLAVNPDGLVPVLLHDGFTVCESSVINAYLDEVFPDPPLMPPGAQGRAQVAMWSQFIDDVTSPAIKKPSYAVSLGPHLQTLDPELVAHKLSRMPSETIAKRWRDAAGAGIAQAEIDQSVAELRRSLQRMSASLAHGPWLVGALFSLADINMAPFIARMATLAQFDLQADWPQVHDWYQRFRNRPAIAQALLLEHRLRQSR